MVQYSDDIFYRLCVTAILYWLHILQTWRLWRGSLSIQLQFSAGPNRYFPTWKDAIICSSFASCVMFLTTLSPWAKCSKKMACFWELTSLKVDMGPQMAKVNQAIKESEKKYVCVIWID